MVSVCIPTYNQAQYLEACVNSILLQTEPANEIIISDDCSTDNTMEILNRLAENNKIIKIIHQPVNLGLTANSNVCLRTAAGEFIVRLGSDDTLCKDFIAELKGLLQKYPQAGYAHCACNETDETGRVVRLRRLHRGTEYESDTEALKKSLKGYRVAANIIMFRKKALERTGFIQSPSNFGEDYYLAADIAAHGFGNVYTPKILANYRVWAGAGNVRVKRKLEEINGLVQVFSGVIEPAYRQRNYALPPVQKARSRFAKRQADCLSWKYFDKTEKLRLKNALLDLSSSKAARLTYYLYENNLHFFITMYTGSKNAFKKLIKHLLHF